MLLSDGAKKFLVHFPRLFHVSHAPDIDTIKKHGLLSTSAILDLLEIETGERNQLEEVSRKSSREFTSAKHGSFVINDQAPLNMKGLQKCLTDMTPAEWIAELNRRIFFFPSRSKAERLASADRARQRPKLTLAFDTADLLSQGEHQFSFASINLGYTLRRATARGSHTLRPLSAFQSISGTPVVEVTAMERIAAGTPFRLIIASDRVPA